jgi:hypothetical protein
MRQTHVGGDKLFVDYAGDTVPVIVDRLTGETRPAQIFVAIMGDSNFTHVEATWRQTLCDWIGAHTRLMRSAAYRISSFPTTPRSPLSRRVYTSRRSIAPMRRWLPITAPVPYGNPRQVTDAGESVDSLSYARSLQVDLAHLYWAVPTARGVGSGNPRTPASAQHSAAPLPEAGDSQQHRPAVVCWALSSGSGGIGRRENHYTSDPAALAPRWISSLLALEISVPRWSAIDPGGRSPIDPRDERRKSVVGRSAHSWRAAQARHRCRTDHGSKVHSEETPTAFTGLENLPQQPCRRHRVHGSVLGANGLVWAVVRAVNFAAQSSRASMVGRNCPPHRRVDSLSTNRGIWVAASAALPYS